MRFRCRLSQGASSTPVQSSASVRALVSALASVLADRPAPGFRILMADTYEMTPSIFLVREEAKTWSVVKLW